MNILKNVHILMINFLHRVGKQDGGEGSKEKETTSDNEEGGGGEQSGDPVKGEAGAGGGGAGGREGSEARSSGGGGGDRETPARQDREGSDDVIGKVQSLSLGVKKPTANQPVVNIPYVPQHR